MSTLYQVLPLYLYLCFLMEYNYEKESSCNELTVIATFDAKSFFSLGEILSDFDFLLESKLS